MFVVWRLNYFYEATMRNKLKYTLLIPLFWACSAPAVSQDQTAAQPTTYGSGSEVMAVKDTSWPVVMKKYLTAPDAGGLVRIDYARLKNSPERASLDSYIKQLESQNPDALSPDAAVSYWANLYNAVTVDVILDNYPVKSIKEIKSGVFKPGPWDLKLITVNGNSLSLNDIEHGIMRKRYPSPHVHYMVNCASVGCPNLWAGEWRAETLQADREQAARDFINSPRGVTVKNGSLTVSSIYKWFKEDFGGNKATTVRHIRQFADKDLAAAIDSGATIRGYEYDWTLNGVGHE